jgi:MFS family permease
VFGTFRLELALFAVSAAAASLLYLPAHSFWPLILVNLIQAAMLAPLVPLSDALALSWSRSTVRDEPGAFEYGWVRGAGSAAFIAGVLLVGQVAGSWGLGSVFWLTAAGLRATRHQNARAAIEKHLRRREPHAACAADNHHLFSFVPFHMYLLACLGLLFLL